VNGATENQSAVSQKNFLKAGIYSIDYKMSSEQAMEYKQQKCDAQISARVIARDSVMPLPVNFGEWHMNQEVEFYLPFDIAFQYENKLFKLNRRPTHFTKIRSSTIKLGQWFNR
jgi:hypothetical protein